jgi:membrane protein DedA with SNARE-associated domain
MIGIVEFISDLIVNFIGTFGYRGIFFAMAIESACIPLPSEIIMPFSGFVVSEGNLTLWGITLAGALGNLFGSLFAYFIGLKGGRPFLERYGKFFLISQKKLQMTDNWFEKHGDKAVFIGRLLPAIRTYISLPAGIARMDFNKFVFYTFLGALPWCFALGYLGVVLGPKWVSLKSWFHLLDAIIILLVIASSIYFIFRYWDNNV